MPPPKDDSDALLTALRHPLRRTILRSLIEDGRTSPKDASRKLEMPLSNISYHFRVLNDCGILTLAEARPVRGSMQHFYDIDEETAKIPRVRELIGIPGEYDGPDKAA